MRGWTDVVGPCRQLGSRHPMGPVFPSGNDAREPLVIDRTEAEANRSGSTPSPRRRRVDTRD